MKCKSFLIIRLVLLAALIGGLLFVGSCSVGLTSEEDSISAAVKSFMPLPEDAVVEMNPEPDGKKLEEIREKILEKKLPEEVLKKDLKGESLAVVPSTLEPDTFEATLRAGESAEEGKSGFISDTPPKGDILFAFDLTGSMYGEVNNVKSNSINIMTAVRGVIPDTNFGVVSHMDYPGLHAGSEYGYTFPPYSSYVDDRVPYGLSSDYPYLLNQHVADVDPVTMEPVFSAINGLTLGSGSDGPESYTRVLYESYSDPLIDWRDGSKKILLFWLDYIPHDLNPFLDGSQPSTGPDPGPDEIDGNGDDLDLASVLNEMNNENITLIALYSGYSTSKWYGSTGELFIDYWEKYSERTGGSAYQINTDGTIPGGVNIADYVAALIEDEVKHVDLISLKAPGYEDWLDSSDEYANVDIPEEGWTGEFDITITVPEGTAPGVYEFEVVLDGDGVEYATQAVTITVVPNEAPVADAGHDVTLEQDSLEGTAVYLDGSSSYDPEGDAVTYEWSWDGGTAAGETPAAVVFPLGETEVILTVTDEYGAGGSDSVLVYVVDTTSPLVTLDLLTDTLWPPNHRMVNVGTVLVSDICDSAPVVAVSITHNEDPHENKGVGDGNTTPDWEIDEDGTIWIRAERNGTGTGRIYTITAEVEDGSGNTSEIIVTVTVPHDQGDKDRNREEKSKK